ncbi:MAG: 16S rRNA (cytosine(1402)-N(4))-methyltransferase RsmH [Candidatus Saccharibacteria bacterium]
MHIPVLLEEVIEYLKPAAGVRFVDGTVGSGGYTLGILKANPEAKVLGLDLDQSSLDKFRQDLAERGLGQNAILVHSNYAQVSEAARAEGFFPVSGIVLDLGFSSEQVDRPERGFSFQRPGPLDMRYDLSQKKTAADIINGYSEKQLVQIFKNYGEENFSNRIAHRLVDSRGERPFRDTLELFHAIREALPKPVKHKAEDSARRIFQAVRIEVNGELENLRKALPQMLDLLTPGGRMVIVSFHSLEDRIVKNYFAEQAQDCVCPPDFPTCVCDKVSTLRILTRKPIRASTREAAENPRSRPAKLRAAEKAPGVGAATNKK